MIRFTKFIHYIFIFSLFLVFISCSHQGFVRTPANDPAVIGIATYTGSFDPPTLAHETLMKMALDNYQVNKLYIFVNISGPKDFKASFKERKEMIAGMLKAYGERVEIVPVLQENRVEIITGKTADKNFYQVIGQDSFEKLGDDLNSLPNRKWLVVPRGDDPFTIPAGANAEIMPDIKDTSSTDVRALILQNRIQEAQINPFVADYIMKHHLYYPYDGEEEVLKKKEFEIFFKRYLGEITKKFPELGLGDMPLPQYIPEQSKAAWSDKFTNKAIQKASLQGRHAEDFKVASMSILEKLSSLAVQDVQKVKIPKAVNICEPAQLINAFGH